MLTTSYPLSSRLNLQRQKALTAIKKVKDNLLGKHVYHPDGRFLVSWNIIIFFFLIYNIFVIPYRISFFGNSDDTSPISSDTDNNNISSTTVATMFFFDYLGDLFFFFDLRLRPRCFGYFEGDKAIMDTDLIYKHYTKTGRFKGRSLCDLLAIMPIEILVTVLYAVGDVRLLTTKMTMIQVSKALKTKTFNAFLWYQKRQRDVQPL